MNVENIIKIRIVAASVGDELKGKLIPTQEHPERNSYAHVWRSVKERFGMSYKECRDDQTDEIIEFMKGLSNEAGR